MDLRACGPDLRLWVPLSWKSGTGGRVGLGGVGGFENRAPPPENAPGLILSAKIFEKLGFAILRCRAISRF